MSYMTRSGIGIGTLPRYVGNRLHVLFHMAGWIIHHLASFKFYLEHHCTVELRNKVFNDVKDKNILDMVWMLAVLGKTVTGPWMKAFYTDKEHFQVVMLNKTFRNFSLLSPHMSGTVFPFCR